MSYLYHFCAFSDCKKFKCLVLPVLSLRANRNMIEHLQGIKKKEKLFNLKLTLC